MFAVEPESQVRSSIDHSELQLYQTGASSATLLLWHSVKCFEVTTRIIRPDRDIGMLCQY